jgi:hypothetical protein
LDKKNAVALSLVAASLLTLSACASRPSPASNQYVLASPPVSEPITPLGTALTSEVGSTVYVHGVRRFRNADLVRFSADMVAQLEAGHAIKIAAGTVAPVKIQAPGSLKATCVGTVKTGVLVRIVPGFSPASACLVDQNNAGSFDVVFFEQYAKPFPLPKPLPYVIETRPPTSSIDYGSVRRELMYGGASNGTLRLSYREFTDTGLARPSFTQDVAYDLDAHGQAEVGFKGLRIQVTSATNSRITYRVVKAMD